MRSDGSRGSEMPWTQFLSYTLSLLASFCFLISASFSVLSFSHLCISLVCLSLPVLFLPSSSPLPRPQPASPPVQVRTIGGIYQAWVVFETLLYALWLGLHTLHSSILPQRILPVGPEGACFHLDPGCRCGGFLEFKHVRVC